MRLSKQFAFLILAFLWMGVEARAQDNAGVCVDARNETNVVIVPDITTIVGACPLTVVPTPFLSQGRRSQLRVLNRKFLTDYIVTVDASTKLPQFRIQDLDEAASLTIPLSNATAAPVSKGAAPKGISGALQVRSAQDLLAELANPATSSQPAGELLSDWITVQADIRTLATDLLNFEGIWKNLDGSAQSCPSALGDPKLKSAKQCLDELNTFLSGIALTDEASFRQLLVSDNDAIAMVNTLSTRLAQQVPLLQTQLSGLQGDLANYKTDANTLAENLQIASDAIKLIATMPRGLSVAQIKARLIQSLNGASKTTLDNTELNALSEELYEAGVTEAGLKVRNAASLLLTQALNTIRRQLADSAPQPIAPACSPLVDAGKCLQAIAAQFDGHFTTESVKLAQDLPDAVDRINERQSRLLAGTNNLYDRSVVGTPLDTIIDLSTISGNAYVRFTVRRVEYFARFTIPQLTTNGVAAPTPAPAGGPGTTASASTGTTTTTTATTSTGTTTTTQITPAASSSSGTSGTPVGHGILELHDLYRATIVGAFAFSGAHEAPKITSTPVTSGSGIPPGGTGDKTVCSSDAPCSLLTVQNGSGTHASVIVGISYHFSLYDTFPHAHHAPLSLFGIFGGLSVQNLNDYYGALSVQPVPGVQILIGGNGYRQGTLASGYQNTMTYAGTPNFNGPQAWSIGPFGGVGLNLSIFRKVFGSATGVGTAATSTTGN
jgi:hypothetical protein